MSMRLRNTIVYGLIGLVVWPVIAALGVVEWEMARVLIVCLPVAYWCGFHDGERFGEIAINVANESHSLRCK